MGAWYAAPTRVERGRMSHSLALPRSWEQAEIIDAPTPPPRVLRGKESDWQVLPWARNKTGWATRTRGRRAWSMLK
jgi:hypothetical protein